MSDELIVNRDGDVTRITINRPGDANRITDAMLGELTELLAADSERARLIVLRGADHTFSVGLAGRGKPPNEAYDFRAGFEPMFKLHESFHRCRAPILAVVEGKAIGFGATLVAASDIVIAAEDARFCLPETAHKILPTTAMARMIGAVSDKALAYMALSAEEFAASDALSAGLVSLVLPMAALACRELYRQDQAHSKAGGSRNQGIHPRRRETTARIARRACRQSPRDHQFLFGNARLEEAIS
jgi:enoyl-CoA hydratase